MGSDDRAVRHGCRGPGRQGCRTRPGLTIRRPTRCLLLLLAALALAVSLLLPGCGGSATDSSASPSTAAGDGEIVVSAASDLAPVLDELGPLFAKESGVSLKTNIGSTGQLTEQIAAGARVDVFLAASRSAIDQLSQKGLLVADSERSYARGRLAMWTRSGSSLPVKELKDLAGDGVKRIAIANPDHAPYGKAAREALEAVGLWEQLQPKLVPAENVRQAFQFAESGNVDVALVALSLVIKAQGTYELVPEELHQPIEQTMAIVKKSERQEQARKFAAFLTGGAGRSILEKYGFVIP